MIIPGSAHNLADNLPSSFPFNYSAPSASAFQAHNHTQTATHNTLFSHRAMALLERKGKGADNGAPQDRMRQKYLAM
eukprot:scaffold240326_cov17-Tisochrysis_lutea.AAC.1